jgi:A/G-specific adenine glycosylase
MRFGSRIPDDISKLRQLQGKGFGEYMAHAILSFAYGQDVPIVDKNVERILTRVFSLKVRKDGHRDPTLWQFAARLVPTGQAKEYNWSLIDFGALVCTPKNPRCRTCPILDICDYGTERVGRLEPA